MSGGACTAVTLVKSESVQYNSTFIKRCNSTSKNIVKIHKNRKGREQAGGAGAGARARQTVDVRMYDKVLV